MTAGPLEEAETNNEPVYDLPKAALDNETDGNSADVPRTSWSPDSLPDDVLLVDTTTALIEEEDVDQASVAATVTTEEDENQVSFQSFTEQDEDPASMQIATFRGQDRDQAPVPAATCIREDVKSSILMASSGDKGESPDIPSHHQKNLKDTTSLLPQDPGTLQIFVGFQNPVWDRLAENNRTSRSRTVSPSDSQNQEKTPGKPEIAPNADVPSVFPESIQLSMGATDPPTLDTRSPGLEPTGTSQNLVWDQLAENNHSNQNRTVSPSDSQNQEKTPGKPEIAPNADVPSILPESVQLSMGATDPSTLDTSSPGLEPTGTTNPVEQEAEGFKELHPESNANPPVLTGEDLAADSRMPQTPPSPNSPAGSAPPSPDPSQGALGRNLLDPSLYRPNVDNDYMRSMTSLLGGGEGSISSLSDILVWSDTATSMGLAVGFLASGHSSPADRLQDEGPSLRAVSSLLNNVRPAFNSGLLAGTGSALRSVTQLLESVERRTTESIRSAFHYLANHFTPRWTRTGPNDN